MSQRQPVLLVEEIVKINNLGGLHNLYWRPLNVWNAALDRC
jgi:hypothetical protein